MALIIVSVEDVEIRISFNVYDLYMSTSMGCHGGQMGNFCSWITSGGRKGFTALTEELVKKIEKHDIWRMVMDEFVKGSKNLWGGEWSNKISGTTYARKSHWVISSPWGYQGTDGNPSPLSAGINTADMMDLLAQFCDAEPEKYGHYVMTEPTECGAHKDNSGFPATRTMVWHPPFIKINRDTPVFTRLTGRYKPLPPPPPVVVKKVKPIKKLPPRPGRKAYVEAKRKRKYGPQPRRVAA